MTARTWLDDVTTAWGPPRLAFLDPKKTRPQDDPILGVRLRDCYRRGWLWFPETNGTPHNHGVQIDTYGGGNTRTEAWSHLFTTRAVAHLPRQPEDEELRMLLKLAWLTDHAPEPSAEQVLADYYRPALEGPA